MYEFGLNICISTLIDRHVKSVYSYDTGNSESGWLGLHMRLGNVRRSITSHTRHMNHQLASKGPNLKDKMTEVKSCISVPFFLYTYKAHSSVLWHKVPYATLYGVRHSRSGQYCFMLIFSYKCNKSVWQIFFAVCCINRKISNVCKGGRLHSDRSSSPHVPSKVPGMPLYGSPLSALIVSPLWRNRPFS